MKLIAVVRAGVLGMVLLAPLAYSEISGPTTASGPFTLTWVSSYNVPSTLHQLNSTNSWSGGSATITLSDGTYQFEERFCFSVFGSYTCTVYDTHTVVVSSGGGSGGGGSSSGALSFADQMGLEIQLHVGDFDSNGFDDIFVNRITGGSIDGSIQDTILYQQSNGTFTKHTPSTSLANTAASYPIATQLAACFTDMNYDGWADLYIENVGAQMGSNLDDLVVFAPAEANSKLPANVLSMTQSVLQFQYDQLQYNGNPNYYSDNLFTTVRPIFGVTIACSPTYDFIPGFCTVTPRLVGVAVQVTGINFNPNAMTVSIYTDYIADHQNFTGDWRWWEVAKRFYQVYGVYAFGFKADGSRSPSNYEQDAPAGTEDEFVLIFEQYLQRALLKNFVDPESVPKGEWEEHQYNTSTVLCSLSEPNCTYENLFCWMTRRPAPRQNASQEVVQDGEEIDLAGGNPITVHVKPESWTVVNETLPEHALHDYYQKPGCGDLEPIPDRCAVVKRTLRDDGTNLIVDTDGHGYNHSEFWKVLNEKMGVRIFKDAIDTAIKIRYKNSGLCVDFTPP